MDTDGTTYYNRWDSANCMFVNNSIDNFDALLRKKIYVFRKWVYDIENDLITCMTNNNHIVNGPMWSKRARALYCVQW